MNENATLPRRADRFGFRFSDTAMEDISGLSLHRLPIGAAINLVPASGGVAAKGFHPLDALAGVVRKLENKGHSVLKFIGTQHDIRLSLAAAGFNGAQ